VKTGEVTEVQRARVREIEETSGARVYIYAYKGRSVVDSFGRYVLSDDPEKISGPLRDFLMGVCGFIAHFDLGGFRGTYGHAHLLLEEMASYSGEMPHLISGRRPPCRVYSDGMTDAEVCQEIAALVDAMRDEAAARYARSVSDEVARRVVDGARLLGWIVVPQGYTLVPAEHAGSVGAADVDSEVRRLAERRGARLVPEHQLF